MQMGRKLGFVSLIIWIIIHFSSREYCYCCTRSCGILIMNIWDYLYVISVLGGVISLLFVLGGDWLFEKEIKENEGGVL